MYVATWLYDNLVINCVHDVASYMHMHKAVLIYIILIIIIILLSNYIINI